MPVDPSLLRNPSNRKLFESQINDIEAARRADADLVESVAGQEQRQQAQQQREAQTAANVQAETNFKNAGRPYYKDEAGRIVPEQNDADWQASQQNAQEQANQEIKWKKEGRKYTKNAVDGSLVALESDEVLAARQQAEGEEIRKRGLTDQMKAITAESGLSRKPLSTTEREKAEKALKKARQEGIYSITGRLGEASKQTDKAGWWDVVNNNPTEAATAAQKRLDRLAAPDADLDDDDLTDLDGNEATKPLAERIRSGRQMLADDDAARQSAETTRQKLADLKLRRDAPDRWAQIQRERVAGMDMPTLQKHAAASSDSLKTRMADFESRAQTVQQEVGQWDTALKALQAENEQARAKGIPASEMVTMSDGSTWHKPLAVKLGEVQAKAQAWESDPTVQQRQKALAVEAKELQGEIALHNETVAAANAKRQAEQDQQFARLAEIPALAGHGAFLQSLVQEQATRRAALDQRFAEGPDTSPEAQAAYAALDADYQTRLGPVQQALEEGDRATAAAVGRAYDMVTQAEARGTNVDQAIAALQKETGVSPEKARSMLGDAAKTDWTRGPAEASRVLSDGRLIVRPNLWTNEAGYRKAVESANASPGAKESALAQFPALREQSAEQQITALQTLTAFRDWQAKQKPGMSAVETVERFSREHGWWRSQRDQLLTGLGQGVIGIMQAGVGAWEWLTGDASSADVYSRLDRDAQRLAGASQALPAGQWTALGASLGVGSLPSLAIGGPIGAGLMRAGMGGAAALGILPRAAGAAKGVLTTAQATNLASGLQMTGVAGVAGVQTFGQVFGEAVQSYQSQGYDLETSQQKAALPAFASGASTMILTALGGFQGTEALARLAKDQGVKKTLGQYAKAVFGGGLKEGALEELPDQLIQSAIAVASYDPNRPMEQILEEAMVALIGGGAMGGAFTALVEAPNVSLSAQAPTPAVNTANLPETIAAAETAIDGYTNTALDPDTLARTQATARTLLYVAQGDIESLPDSDLALVGVGRNAKGELENVPTPDGAPPRVKIESGQPIITQTTLDKLEKEMPAVRAAIPLDEASRRQANSTPPPTNEQTTSPGNPPVTATSGNPGSTPAGQSQQPGNPAGPAGGTPGTQTGSQPQELTEDAAERAEQIAVHLAERGLTEPQARAAAQAIVAEQGIVGAEYSEQVTQQAFDAAMGRQGWVRGSGRKYQWIPPTDNAVPSEATQPISPGTPGAASTANATGSQATPEASGRPGQGPASPAKGGEGLTQGAAGATPASAAPAGGMDTDAFVEARRKAIAATPPDKRRGAVKLLGSLEKALTRYGSAFDGVRFAAKDGSGLNLAGGGLVVQREQGKVFLDVDLARWADQHAGLVDKAGVVATTEVEEEFVHRAAVAVISDGEMQTFWRSLPAALQEAVYQGYHAVDIQHGSLPAKAPVNYEDRQAVQLGHEFLRMLVQDSQFQGRVSEAIAVDPRLGEKIIAFLKKLADRLRKLIDSAPTDVRVNVREYEAKVTKEVQRLRKSLPDALKAKETQPGQGMATAEDNRTAVVKAGSTAPLPRTNFAPTEGATGTAHTDSNDAIEYRWAVVDVSSLNISNADDGKINPDYPQELQPRDRTSAGSEAQVTDIAKNMNLDRLSQASGVGDGAPIVGPDGVVESGNGRVMGMRRAHTQGTQAAGTYSEKLAATAATYGLTAEQVKAVKHPVLVRVRTTDVDRVAFVLSANVSTIAPKREIEQAKIDAKQIVPDLFASFVPSEDGDVFTAANADFLRGYVSAIIPPAERPSIIDAKGNLTQTGLRRIRNALFVHAYGDSPESLNALARLTESIDSSGTNIASALVAAAPRFAEQNSRIAAGALYPLSITGDLAQTVQTLQDLRGRGEKIRDFLDQDRIPGIGDDPTPMQKELLQFLDENAGRPRAIVDAFNRYASAVDGAGDPKQASLFGDEPRPTALELWRLASRPASIGKGTVSVENITPQNALRVYRRLKKMEAEQGTLSGTQSQALERAERALGQLFMFEEVGRPAALPSSTKSITPAWLKPVDSLLINDTLGRYGLSAADSFRNPRNSLERVTGKTDSGTGGSLSAGSAESRGTGGSSGERTGRDERSPGGLAALPRLDLSTWYREVRQVPADDVYAGQEHAVYHYRHPQGDRAVKLTFPGEYGVRGSLESYLRQMEEQNEIFDMDIAIEGWFQFPGEPGTRLATSQAWIAGMPSTLPEIDIYMRRKGFHRAYDGAWWNGTVLVTDALPKNFVTDVRGYVYPIDLVIATPQSSAQIERLDNLVASQAQPNPGPEPAEENLNLSSLLSPAQQELKESVPSLTTPESSVPLPSGTKREDATPEAHASDPAPVLASSSVEEYVGPDDSRFLDRWTSGTSFIRGQRVTREQGQRIGALWRGRLRSGLREGADFDWTPGADLANRLANTYPGVPVLTPAQFGRLANLPIIGEGFEGTVHADRPRGVVYKVIENNGLSGAGIWNEPGWSHSGKLDWQYQPASRPRHLGLRLGLLNLMGGTPTELVGISPMGRLILKQPLSPDPEAAQERGSFAARHDAGIVDVPEGMLLKDGYKAHVVVVEGRPWLVTDLVPDNYVGDNQGDVRVNDPVFGQLKPNVISKVPGLAGVVRQAATEAQRLGDRSARLFKSTVSPGDASPMARLGWNHLDRAVSAKLAAHARWMNEKTGAGETVARWAGSENSKPFVALARVLKRELLPDSMLPREVAARKREMEIKTALGAQRAMDLVRALSNAPKFSDMAYPPEFSHNPAHRRDLYLAMAREKAMSSLPQPMQDLARRLREMLLEMGRESVKQGRMSLDTFAALQDGYMPHYYKEDVQREKSLFHRFRLGLRDILAQRTTAWHIVDHSSKDSTGQPRIVSWQGNQWRFRNEGHRDAFYEDFILQQALEQITNRNGKANRNLTLSDLRAPAKLPPETRGRLKEILRALRSQYTKEKPLTVEEQEKAGLIMDPVYAIARYTAQMVHDNSTAEFFNFVAANPDWVSGTATPGFTEIPDNPRFGRLAGKYVTDDVARQLLEMVEAPNVALQIYDTLLGWWKMGKTVYNIGTHARNVLSNVLFSQLAGNSAWNLGNIRYYREAIHALRNGGHDLQEAYEMGVLGADFVTAELRQTLRQLLPDPATIEDDGRAPGILLGIGRSIGKFIPQALKNPLHRAHNQITALYQAEDEVFKLSAYLKAKSMGLSSEQARDHVRQWFPYFDGGTSMTLKALGRTTMPFLGFYRESIRIFGQALKERPVALAAGMVIPSLLTLFSAMLLGLDEEDLDEVKQTALRGKASGLLGLTPLDREPLFSILLPWRTEGGNLQQFDLSAIYPFTEMLGERIEGTEGQDWWQRQWRKLITAGPLGSLAYSFGANEDPFSRQPLVEPGMSGWEAFQKRFEHTYQALLPPLTPGIPGLTVGGSNIETLSKSGALPWQEAQRSTDKTLQMRSAPEAFVRAVLGLDVRSANPSLYELADAWRKANGYEVNEGTDYGSTTPVSRARKALFKELAQETPNLKAIGNISAALKKMGAPVETEQDINRLLFYRDPLKIIGGNKKLGITPQDAQERFRASLKGESRRVLDAALRTFADIKQRAPALLRQANLL